MKSSPFHWFALIVFAWSLGSAATPDKGSNVFSLLPKSFQKNPRVDFNIITEVTKEGRDAPQPAPGVPIYYLSKPGSFVQLGHGASHSEKPPEVDRLEKALEQSLIESGYLGADKDHPPKVVIVYSWGSHSSPVEDGISDPASDTPSTISNEVLIKEMVERARLVGGEKFAQQLVKAMAEEGAARRATYKPREDPSGNIPPQPNIMGDASNMMTQVFSPIERFRESSSKNRGLMQDAGGSIYFLVASAYDLVSATTNSKILLWRTKMSVNSSGLSLTETLPALISAAAPYFGKDMAEPEVLGYRVNREGSVRLVPLEIKDYYGDTAPANEAKKNEQPTKPKPKP